MSNKTLSGLVVGNFDEIYSEFYQDVPNQSITYLEGLTSNVQQQIDTIAGSGGSGGYFLIWSETANGYSTANSGYQWSYGANGTNATNVPLILGFSCNLIKFALRSSSIPTTTANIQILKNGSIVYTISSISTNSAIVDLSSSGISFNPNDTISLSTASGSGGGLIRISLSFSSNGVTGPAGQGLTYKGTYSSSIAYDPYDFVYYNGSSYICTSACVNIVPTNQAYWGLMAIQGQQGQKGDTGDRGPRGYTGDTGPQGERGPKGDSGSIANIADVALAVLGTAGFATVQAEISTLQAEMIAVQTDLAVVDAEITTLQSKTMYQENAGAYTRFTSDLAITNGIANTITLHPSGTIDCYNIENAETVTTHTLNSTNLYNAQTIATTTLNTSTILPDTSDITQTISIGPTSQFGNVVINGYVTMPLMANFFGFNVNNGFINQF